MAKTTTTPEATTNWRADMAKAGTLKDRAGKADKQAGILLWNACKAGVTEWLSNKDSDGDGEGLYAEFITAYGESRKGDCSKMKTVALATANNGLVLDAHENLSQAYAEARRLTKTVKDEATEDNAADEAVSAIEAPKTSGKPEGAALIVMSKGVDEAARLLLDALGPENTAAHRAFLRAVSQEINGRNKPAPKADVDPDAEKAGATKAKKAPATRAKATPKSGADKKAAASAKAKAASAALKAKADDAGVEPIEADEPETDDMFDEFDVEPEVEETPAPVKRATPVKRAVPVRRK